jgi:hypothetical protein
MTPVIAAAGVVKDFEQVRALDGLDLTVELDDPGNALPPSRIRFRLDATRDAARVEDNGVQ